MTEQTVNVPYEPPAPDPNAVTTVEPETPHPLTADQITATGTATPTTAWRIQGRERLPETAGRAHRPVDVWWVDPIGVLAAPGSEWALDVLAGLDGLNLADTNAVNDAVQTHVADDDAIITGDILTWDGTQWQTTTPPDSPPSDTTTT